MVSFLSFRRSTESVPVSYVSRQDPGSSSSPESVTDPGSSSSPELITNSGSSSSLESVPDPRSSSSPEVVNDPGSSSSPELIPDPGSDSSSDSLQWSPEYSSVDHSSSGLTFPLWSCHKSQTNNQHDPVKQHTPELQLVYPGNFLYEEKLCHEYVWPSQFKTTFILRNVPCKQTSQGSPKFRYIPITSMVGPILIMLLEK